VSDLLSWFGEASAPAPSETAPYYERPLFDSFVKFAKAHIESGDIDPAYPVLKEVYRMRGYSRETALWHTLLYVTWYNVGSAEEAFARYPNAPSRLEEPLTLPTGTERRSFRGNDLARTHLNALLERARPHGSLSRWAEAATEKGGEAGWDGIRTEFQSVKYAGPWSSYKLADLLAHVHDFPITASDLGIGGASETAGPIPGMVKLTGYDWKKCATDLGLQRELLARSRDRGVPFSGLDQLETSLCDFNSLCKGRYYVGHDLDQQMEHLRSASAAEDFWTARRKTFPVRYLGEVNGWFGVRKSLKDKFHFNGDLVQI